MTPRRQRRFAAQQMLLLLTPLAHHLRLWSRTALAHAHPPLARLSIRRLVRVLWAIPGQAFFDPLGDPCHIVLNARLPLAPPLVHAFSALHLDPILALSLG
jgi:hypothetical protein